MVPGNFHEVCAFMLGSLGIDINYNQSVLSVLCVLSTMKSPFPPYTRRQCSIGAKDPTAGVKLSAPSVTVDKIFYLLLFPSL